VTASTVPELLRERARERPDRIGYSFLVDGDTEEVQLTYGQLDLRAGAVAAAVRAAGGVADTRVLLVFPPGLDFVTAFFGCLAAGVVAVPVYPPDPAALDRTLPRLLAVVRDAGPTIALTTSPLLGQLDLLRHVAPDVAALRWLAVDTLPDAGDGLPEPAAAVGPDAVAVLQYTSGSTSVPRGVVLTHRNLLHNSHLIQQVFGTTEESRGVSWLPPYHDMGLVGGLLQPLFAGCPVTLMSPLHFLEEPMRWLRAIDRCRGTVSGGPNFAYELCIRAAEQAPPDRLDLSSWEVAFNGAEPIRAQTLRRFADAFAPAGFRPDAALPCYGLAEATLIVSGARRRGVAVAVDRLALEQHVAAAPADGRAVELTSCGRGTPDQRILIVDPATRVACPPGRIGEVWVGGPSVAQGYWRRPAETEQVFRARTGDGDDGPFLRTGDLGFLHDGDLVVTGRIKDLLIVRGRNHYPQDIELTAERADPGLRRGGAAAFLVDADGPEAHLVVVLEVRRQADTVDVGGVAARVRRAVAVEQGLEVRTVVLVRAGGIPKTSSGKVQRWRCRQLYLAGRLPEVSRLEVAAGPAASTEPVDAREVLAADPARRPALLERYVRDQIARLGGLDPGDDPGDLDRRQPLLAAGLDSLTLTRLRSRMEAELGVGPPLAELLSGASLSTVVDRLAARIGPGDADRRTPPTLRGTAPAGTEYTAPLSVAQQWMWLQHQLDPGTSAFTVPVALRLLDPVDHAALRRALDTVVARHPVLRTTFALRDGAPVQVVHPTGRAAFEEHDVRHLDAARLTRRLTRDARRPFDLDRGPLLRLDLYRHPDGEVMLLTVHHIITDFWSMTVLARELADAYATHADGRQPEAAAPPAPFADVAVWQSRLLDDPVTAQPLTRYWDEQVGDGVPGLGLPVVPAGRGVPGGSRGFALSAASTGRLRARAAEEKVTLHVLLLAAVQTMLHGLTGRTDLALGTSAAGRSREEFAEVMGCCTNPVMIRDRIAGDEPFRALLLRTRARVIAALEHQDYPMILLAKRHRAANRGRMIEALFTFNRSPSGDDLSAAAFVGVPGVRRRLGSLYVETVALEPGGSTRALELAMAEVDGRLHGLLRYGPGALDEESAARFVDGFAALLARVAEDPGVLVADLTGAPVPAAG